MRKNTAIKNRSKWPSFMKASGTDLKKSKESYQKAPLKLLTRASEVKMHQFIDCICRHDYNVLVEQGEATAQQLADAWSSLFFEYCDLISLDQVKVRVMLASEINLIRTRHKALNTWLKFISNIWSENIANAIRTLGYEINQDTVDFDIDIIQAELRFERIHLKIKEVELESMDSDGQSAIDDAYFTKMFFRINNYAKREAVNKQSTVQEYCVALKDFNDYLKAIKN